ncbi:hypothetical protein [Desertifilum sp. FACHB-866]|uniref:hypothetical protein n=1 Tax=Desertifilum sp. FACHB-866 TaxID=2692796 RepID=UPI0016859AF5|nr:hypothetical protein [Desertifilum sp. FACHB-866]MBD2334748.1 hypothetical protein [Desertifilum sp. FACHB-868]
MVFHQLKSSERVAGASCPKIHSGTREFSKTWQKHGLDRSSLLAIADRIASNR